MNKQSGSMTLTENEIKAIVDDILKNWDKKVFLSDSARAEIIKIVEQERIKAKKLLEALEEIQIQTDERSTEVLARKAIREYNKTQPNE